MKRNTQAEGNFVAKGKKNRERFVVYSSKKIKL